MFRKDIGIDLGTANILIYVKGEGVILTEPSVLVMNCDNNMPIAFGQAAYEMIGRTPGKIEVIKPMKDGVIANFEATEMILNHFIDKVKGKVKLVKPRILICCPTNVTQVEKNSIIEAAFKAGSRKVFIEEEPKVAAIGAGLDISKPEGNMVVDIGGGTTEIAVLSLGDIVTSASIKVAGNAFDQDIIKYIKDKYRLLIGEKTAENIKKTIGVACNGSKKNKMNVRGRDLTYGLPKVVEITEEEIEKALEQSLDKIITMIKSVLEQTPPELSADIMEKGIMLTGGGALLNNLKELLSQKLEIPVTLAESPLTCVAEGTGILLEKIHLIDR